MSNEKVDLCPVMLVTFIIVFRNAECSLADLLTDISEQDYPHDKFEILCVDGCSTDNSLNIIYDFQSHHADLFFKILSNPGKILSAGWNVALAHAKGEVILRVDAHSRIPRDFIRKNVDAISRGESIVGGARVSRVPNEKWPAFFALAEESRFGAGAAGFKHPGPARYVETLAHAAYRKHIFSLVGGYDERLVRNQDMEIHYRMRQAGFKFYFNPEIVSFHFPRSNMSGLLKQKFGTGYWIAITASISPKCFCARHFVPAIFVFACLVSLIFAMLKNVVPLVILILIYFFCAVFFSFRAMREANKDVKPLCCMLPGTFFLIHFAYGVGTLAGMFNIPKFLIKYRGYKVPRLII